MSNTKPVGKFRKATSYTVQYPTVPSIKIQPKELTLTQKQKNHDVLVLEYYGTSLKNAKLLKTGVPIKFSWKQGSRKMEWLGYVSSVSRKSGTQKAKPMKVYCVGSSFVLKERKTKTYKNKTIPEVAAIIAKQNKLRFVGENHTRRFPQLVMAGHSQWEWLHEQANRIGYAMYVQGTNLVFRPVDKLIDEFSTDAPLMQMWNPSVPKQFSQIDRTLESVDVLVGENVESSNVARANKQVGGVDPVTSKSFTAKKTPTTTGSPVRTSVAATLFDEVRSDQVANFALDAKDAAEGAAQLARFNVPAKALGQGDPRIHPYRILYVEGTGEQTDGYWLVNEVVHKMSYVGFYNVELKIAIDGTEQNRKGPKRNGDKRVGGQINLKQLMATQSSFSVSDNSFTLNLGHVLGTRGVGSGRGVPSSARARTSRLVLREPILTNVNNQGFTRTKATWETTVPSSTNVSRTRAVRTRSGAGNGKCRCC